VLAAVSSFRRDLRTEPGVLTPGTDLKMAPPGRGVREALAEYTFVENPSFIAAREPNSSALSGRAVLFAPYPGLKPGLKPRAQSSSPSGTSPQDKIWHVPPGHFRHIPRWQKPFALSDKPYLIRVYSRPAAPKALRRRVYSRLIFGPFWCGITHLARCGDICATLGLAA
jgi:hypothetical protein